MLANKRGGVLNVASTAAFQPGPLMANYYASKAYVLSFSEALWEEARGTGVHVELPLPGPTVSNLRARRHRQTRLANASKVMASALVAREGYNGFKRNKRVVVTGGNNKFIAGVGKYLPRETLKNGAQYPIAGGSVTAAGVCLQRSNPSEDVWRLVRRVWCKTRLSPRC
ncbi:MAG: SDR family NAD(P)-dependent oxidoreductase [Hyphomonadaceae bacterium]